MEESPEKIDEKANSESRKTSHDAEASRDAEMALLFDAVKTEYEHSIKRSEKLDNKVYILLTVCAFEFVMLSDVIKHINNVSFPQNSKDLLLIIIFSILLLSCIVLFIAMLISLANLLKPMYLRRLESKIVLNEDLVIMPSNKAFRTICILYEQCVENNDRLLEKRFTKFRKCVNMMIFVICDLIALAVLCQFV